MAKQKTIFGKLEFDLLSKIAKLVLMLPYSNAGEDWVFSMVQKTRQAHASLGFNTLGAIFTVKMSNKDSIHFRSSQDVLKSTKSATWD